jgi:prepilin-type processing-associated H-X9-DG protein
LFGYYYQSSGVADDPIYNLGLKKDSWVPEPSRFIMMHDPAPYPWAAGEESGAKVLVAQWHEASNPGKMFEPAALKSDRDRLIGPVLFVDGHAKRCDFTAVMKSNPLRGLDPTKDWMWYKPLR